MLAVYDHDHDDGEYVDHVDDYDDHVDDYDDNVDDLREIECNALIDSSYHNDKMKMLR